MPHPYPRITFAYERIREAWDELGISWVGSGRGWPYRPAPRHVLLWNRASPTEQEEQPA